MTVRRGILAVAALGLILATSKGFADTNCAKIDGDALTAAVGQQVDKLLAGRPHGGEKLIEKAAAVRKAVSKKDFAAAGRMLGDVYGKSALQSWSFAPFGRFMGDFIVQEDKAFGEGLADWVVKEKDNPLAHLARAEYLHDEAWKARGERTVDKVGTGQLSLFDTDIEAALAENAEAAKLDPKNPYLAWQRLEILFGRGNSSEMEEAFQDGITSFPAYYNLYGMRLRSLAPKWGGSAKEIYAFLDKYAKPAPKDSPLRMLYLDAYGQFIDAAEFDCGHGDISGDTWRGCFVSKMQDYATSDLYDGVKGALGLYKTADRYQYNSFIRGALTPVVGVSATDNQAADILQFAAVTTGSDNQLIETNPGNNDYVLDLLTAAQWHGNNYKENAEKKYKEALADLERAPFPGEEEKNLVVGEIYSLLGTLFNEMSQVTNAIAYETAAEALTGKSVFAVVCHDYLTLEDYPAAIKECTRVLDSTGYIEARFWRAKAYRESGDNDNAAKDYTAVADSTWNNRFRTSAAIDLTVVYGNQKDYKAQLGVFDRYPWLFDPNAQDHEDLAVAYNNRCYALMKLDRLQKALDDCNMSLRYANIPDAVEKRREIQQRLKGHEQGL
jgi:tetratricopeptide (TPR) repeat protein